MVKQTHQSETIMIDRIPTPAGGRSNNHTQLLQVNVPKLIRSAFCSYTGDLILKLISQDKIIPCV